MRSIFGKCIATAMMAAIALVWQSPPVHADLRGDLSAARTSARSDARDATRAVSAAEKAAEDATDAAEDARTAADAAMEAAERAGEADASAADIRKADAAADDADEAADAAMDRSGNEKDDATATPPIVASALDAEDAWGQHKQALTMAGTEHFVIAPADRAENVVYHDLPSDATDYEPDLMDKSVIPFFADDFTGEVGDFADGTNAWDNYRETQWEYFASRDSRATTATTSEAEAEEAAEAAEMARKNAETAAKNAEGHLRFALNRSMFAQKQAVIATEIAATATATALSKAKEEYAKDNSYANFTDLNNAEEAAEAAVEAAADAAKAVADSMPEPTTPTCGDDEELVGDMCKPVCGTGMTRGDDGICMAITCNDGMELIGDMCMDECATGEMRGEDNMCEAITCGEGEELVGNECMDACDAGMMRDEENMCMANAKVSASGVGNLLKFGYWTTMGKDTLLAVTNLGKDQETVNVKVMDGMGAVKGTIPVCLGAGDTWTAAMVASGEADSMVEGGNPGECSGAMPDTTLMGATYGFIEVYPADMDMDMNGHLMGIATVVSVEMGYASSYNATSLMADLGSDTKADDIEYALAMEGGIPKDMLLGRWGANAMIGGMTQIMLTFPVPDSAPTEAVAIMVTDEAGNSTTVSSMMLNKAVNMCTFMTDDMGATTLSCNGSEGMPVTVNEGWFKIMDSTGMGFPVIGMVSQAFNGTLGMFDQSYPVQWMEMME